MSGYPVITYRRHNCGSRHRTWSALKRCIWPRAEWVSGCNQWASVAYCRVTTVVLWPTEAQAREALDFIDSTGCGGACRGRNGHALIKLDGSLTEGLR